MEYIQKEDRVETQMPENIPNDLYGKYSIWKYQADLFTPHLCIEKSREESPRESFEYCKDLKFSFNSGLSVCAK